MSEEKNDNVNVDPSIPAEMMETLLGGSDRAALKHAHVSTSSESQDKVKVEVVEVRGTGENKLTAGPQETTADFEVKVVGSTPES